MDIYDRATGQRIDEPDGALVAAAERAQTDGRTEFIRRGKAYCFATPKVDGGYRTVIRRQKEDDDAVQAQADALNARDVRYRPPT
jgi:hypothetical protein